MDHEKNYRQDHGLGHITDRSSWLQGLIVTSARDKATTVGDQMRHIMMPTLGSRTPHPSTYEIWSSTRPPILHIIDLLRGIEI